MRHPTRRHRVGGGILLLLAFLLGLSAGCGDSAVAGDAVAGRDAAEATDLVPRDLAGGVDLSAGVDAPTSADGVDVGVPPDGVDAGVPPDGVDAGVPGEGPRARFDLPAAATDFFAFPWPSALRLTGDGHPSLAGFPTQAAVDTLTDLVPLAEARATGASCVTAVYFAFDGPLDPASLPPDAAATVEAEAAVYVIDVDPGSPERGRRHPVRVSYHDAPDPYRAPHTLVAQPLFGLPLRDGTQYAVVVTTAVRGADGRAVTPPDAWRDVLEGRAAPALADAYAPLLELLEGDSGRVAVATVFTTAAPVRDFLRLRAWLEANGPAPEVAGLHLSAREPLYDVYEGSFPSLDIQAGIPPYRRIGDGAVGIGADGAPASRTPFEQRLVLAVPTAPAPPGGWPVVVYHHDIGGDAFRLTQDGLAAELAARGVAVLGIDQPLHGLRNPTGEDAADLLLSLSLSNPLVDGSVVRQGAADLLQLARLLRTGVVVPAEASATGEAVRTDPGRTAFLGHGLGARTGALFLAVEDDVRAGVFSAAPSGAFAYDVLETEGVIDHAAMLRQQLGITAADAPLTAEHPFVACVAQPLADDAAALGFVRHIVRDPPGATAHDLLLTVGYHDTTVPPPSTEAVAAAAGLPVAAPQHAPVEAMSLQGLTPVALPVSGNLPESAGRHPTGALLQIPEGDHAAALGDPGVRSQVFGFLRSALDGEATLEPAPAP